MNVRRGCPRLIQDRVWTNRLPQKDTLPPFTPAARDLTSLTYLPDAASFLDLRALLALSPSAKTDRSWDWDWLFLDSIDPVSLASRLR